MTLHARFGLPGHARQTYLPGTDPALLPDPAGQDAPPHPDALAPEPYMPGADGTVALFDGRVAATTTGSGTADDRTVFDVVGAWNSVKNAAVASDGAEDLAFLGFVHVDAAVGLSSTEGSVLEVVGAKRGNLATGAGADRVDIQVASNVPLWSNEFRVSSGAGDDEVRLSLLDVEAAAQRGDATFAPGTPDAPVSGYGGGWTAAWVDLGDGGDVFSAAGGIPARVQGGAGADSLSGGRVREALSGGEGADTLDGGGGADTLDGGAGNDFADDGRDDVMTGGRGADTFVLSRGGDRITDFSPAATQVLIDFEGIADAATFAPIPDGYKGLDWDNFYASGDNPTPGSGYENVVSSPIAGGFDGYGSGASFTSPQDFDLRSGYFAAAWNNDLTLTIQAWDDGVQVGAATIVLDQDKVFVDFEAGTAAGVASPAFTGRFTSVDEFRMDGTGGTGGGSGGGGEHVAVDDLLLGVGGDVIDVPADTDVEALVAGARSDGVGGTVLDGGLTLEHTDPSDVSASWFV